MDQLATMKVAYETSIKNDFKKIHEKLSQREKQILQNLEYIYNQTYFNLQGCIETNNNQTTIMS